MAARRLDVVPSGLLVVALWLSAVAADRVHRIEFADLPQPVRQILTAQGLSSSTFSEYIQRVEADTEERAGG